MASFGGVPVPALRRRGPARYPLTIARNVPFDAVFRLKNGGEPMDLAGYEAAVQVRGAGRRREHLLVDFALLAGGITITPGEGLIALRAEVDDLADVPLIPAEWELLVTLPPNDPIAVLYGPVQIAAGTTEWDHGS